MMKSDDLSWENPMNFPWLLPEKLQEISNMLWGFATNSFFHEAGADGFG